jgi:hypothetical protein
VQQQHYNSCLQQYRKIYSAAAALKLLSSTIQEHLQCSSSTKTAVSNNTGTFTVQQQHYNSCLQQYRKIYSAAAALKLLSSTIQEHLQCNSSTKTAVSNNTGTFTVQQQH